MADLYLALALHNHQPVGNFDWVFREAYERAYEPMVAALERHPGVRLTLHNTGPVRDWLARHEPRFLRRIRALVERGQVEVLAGGYYEPVLASLPDADKHGQIRKLVEAIEADFGQTPTGAWLAERVWEPYLPKPLAEAGIAYTILDDTHFKHAGYDPERIRGYYVTEEQGRPLNIFATSLKLRYTIPWRPVGEIIAWLREQAAAIARQPGTAPLLAMGDDGEKFGLWPDTHHYIWEEDGGWIENFFAALEANAGWLATITPGDYLRRFPASGRIYLPTTSYDEMTEWSLPAEAAALHKPIKSALQTDRPEALRFLRGGFWRNFMVKYPEVNTLHKKALGVSALVHAMRPGEARRAALDELWMGQGNCPYWHGVFGGIYLGNVRSEMFTHLIRAENLALGDVPGVAAEVVDADLDGAPEVVLRSRAFNLYVDPADGGSVYEWDWRPAALNLANVLSRRFEAYHDDLIEAAKRRALEVSDRPIGDPKSMHEAGPRVKEARLEDALHYDWHRRASLIDHILGAETTLDAYARASYPELGDFANQPYGFAADADTATEGLRLRRDGNVWQDGRPCPLRIEKRLRLAPEVAACEVAYRLTSGGSSAQAFRFGVESDWALLGAASPESFCEIDGGERSALHTAAEAGGVSRFRLVDPPVGAAVTVSLDRPATLWRFPLETVSASEGGFERVLQGISILPHWHVHLEPGESFEVRLRIEVSSNAEGG